MNAKWRDHWTPCSTLTFAFGRLGNHSDGDLKTAFSALGLDRVVAGARALHMSGLGWHDCFLALAYGGVGALRRLIPRGPSSHPRGQDEEGQAVVLQ
jgi:hypothetical protein